MNPIGISILLLLLAPLFFNAYYVVVYNQLWETERKITSLKNDIISESNKRWYCLEGLVAVTYANPNTEERVLSKLIEKNIVLLENSSVMDIHKAEKHYTDTKNQYLMVVGTNSGDKHDTKFNKAMNQLNLAEENIVALKTNYNNAVKIHNSQFDINITSYIANIAEFKMHKTI